MKILRTETLYTGPKFDLAAHVLEGAAGTELRREFLDHPGSVVLVPRLPDNQIVLLRNYRHTIDQVLWELPAGTAVRGEPAEITAARELAEETGYRAGRLYPLLSFFPAPGIANEKMIIFLADELVAGAAEREADEEMVVEIVPFSTAQAMARRGAIVDGKTLVALWAVATLATSDVG